MKLNIRERLRELKKLSVSFGEQKTYTLLQVDLVLIPSEKKSNEASFIEVAQ